MRRTDDRPPTARAQGADPTELAPNEEEPGRAAGSPPEASDREQPPSQPIHVVVLPGEVLQSAITARFAAVIEIFRQTTLEEGIPVDLYVAAFHLEWIVMRLLLTFVRWRAPRHIQCAAWIEHDRADVSRTKRHSPIQDHNR